jgi:hypothetical protein
MPLRASLCLWGAVLLAWVALGANESSGLAAFHAHVSVSAPHDHFATLAAPLEEAVVMIAFDSPTDDGAVTVKCVEGPMEGELLRPLKEALAQAFDRKAAEHAARRLEAQMKSHWHHLHGRGSRKHVSVVRSWVIEQHASPLTPAAVQVPPPPSEASRDHEASLLGLLMEEEEPAAGRTGSSPQVDAGVAEFMELHTAHNAPFEAGTVIESDATARRGLAGRVISTVLQRASRHRAISHPSVQRSLRCRTVEVAAASWATRETIVLSELRSTRLHTVVPHAVTPSTVMAGSHAALLQTAEEVASRAGEGSNARLQLGARAAATLASYLRARLPGMKAILGPILGLVLTPMAKQTMSMVGRRLADSGDNVDHGVNGKAAPIIAGAMSLGLAADITAVVPDTVAVLVKQALPKALAVLSRESVSKRLSRISGDIVSQLLSPRSLDMMRQAEDPGSTVPTDPHDLSTDPARELPPEEESIINDAMGFPSGSGPAGVALGAGPELSPRRSGTRRWRSPSAGEWAGNSGLDGAGWTAVPSRARDFLAAAFNVEELPERLMGDRDVIRPADGEPIRPSPSPVPQSSLLQADGYPAPPSALVPVKIRGRLEDVLVEAVSREMSARLERSLSVLLTQNLTRIVSIAVTAGVARGVGGPWPASKETLSMECRVCEGHGNVGGACDRCHSGRATGSESDQYASYYGGYYGAYYAHFYSQYYGESVRALDPIKATREWRVTPPWGPRWFASRCAPRTVPGINGDSAGDLKVVCNEATEQREGWWRSEADWRKNLEDAGRDMSEPLPPVQAGLWRDSPTGLAGTFTPREE